MNTSKNFAKFVLLVFSRNWNISLKNYINGISRCIFILHLHEDDQKRWSFSLKTITFEDGLQSWKIWKRIGIVFSENVPSTRQRYEDDMKTIENDMKTYYQISNRTLKISQ